MTKVYQIYAGKSEAVEAEYSSRADAPYTIAEAYCGEIYAVLGFRTKAAMKAALKDYRNDETTIEIIA